VTISATLLERRGAAWAPHETSALLASFTMLDPYVRQPMRHEGGGRYSLTVKAPDVYGVFKWVLRLRARGWSFVDHEEVTPVRPFRHNEFPRFVAQAWPYYATVLSLMAGFLVMIVSLMLHRDTAAAKA